MIPCSRGWLPPLVFLPGESHRQMSLEGYSSQGYKESDTTDQLSATHSTPLLLSETDRICSDPMDKEGHSAGTGG